MYHTGAPAELVLLGPAVPEYQAVCLSRPQAFIPARRWMAARVIPEDEVDWGSGRAPERRWTPDRRAARELRWTLVTCVVTPGFDYDDFELAERDELLREFPGPGRRSWPSPRAGLTLIQGEPATPETHPTSGYCSPSAYQDA